MIYFSLSLVLLLSLSPAGWGQPRLKQAATPASLTRKQVVVDETKPSVYLCVNRNNSNRKNEHNEDVLWFRVFNNTIWTIRFRSSSGETNIKPLKLSNGKLVAGLTEKSVFVPHYEVEDAQTHARRMGPSWGDIGTVSFLPPGTSALFSVPRSYLKDSALFLEYKYEWEFTGVVADESYAPVHRVYLAIVDPEDISSGVCH